MRKNPPEIGWISDPTILDPAKLEQNELLDLKTFVLGDGIFFWNRKLDAEVLPVNTCLTGVVTTDAVAFVPQERQTAVEV